MPPFVVELPVRFADVDHAGIVYYPRFFHFFHLAFEELWRARRGAAAYAALIAERRVGFPAVRAECTFVSPLRFGDIAEVELRLVRRGTTSLTFGYRVARQVPGVAAVLAADGSVVCAVVDLARFAAIAPPADVLGVLDGLDDPPRE